MINRQKFSSEYSTFQQVMLKFVALKNRETSCFGAFVLGYVAVPQGEDLVPPFSFHSLSSHDRAPLQSVCPIFLAEIN